ncbi:MAG: tripartite tricarboxylate transporter substrate binding protein [Bradyrhizobium sp.]|nr:tripartite tricarboxylate transporter substrate binding protein [Bradyrhizobium sp.]
MELSRRSLLGAAVLPLVAPVRTQAQTWPSGPIRFIVPFPPGGSTDALARVVQSGLQQRLGANIIIENRPGASGAAGTAVFAKSLPDGNTWLLVFDTHSVNPYLMNLQYDTEKDLDPVMLVATAPYLLAVSTKHDFKTLAEVVTAAKAKPDGLSYASVGSGSIGHLFMVLLQKKTGVKLTHVPYRGGGPAMNDALGGHVDFIIGSVALVTPQLGSGKLRPIVQTGEKRVPALTDVPTVTESVPDLTAYTWWGVFAPAGTPKPIVERFNKELAETIKEERVTKALTESQQMTLVMAGPEELRKFNTAQGKLWGPVVKENDIKGEM